MDIQAININKLKKAEYNPRKDLKPTDREYQKIKKSIQEFGYVEPIIINKDCTIIGGHQRLKVLKDLGYEEVQVVILDVDKTKEKALNIALNKISGEWDLPLLKDLLQDIDTGEIDIELTGFDSEELEELFTNIYNDILKNEQEEKYTKKVEIPTYEPKTEVKPQINELFNDEKTKKLLKEIENSNIDKNIKEFLKIATYRHIVFNYENIAEYYSHSDKKIQELMEKSALVIIDFDKAIAEGYTQLSNKINEAYGEDYE